MELLRFVAVGSVDDGKSTLIGRLLYDSKAIFQDQLDSLERASIHRGNGAIDLSLLTDGLRAEREQGITIDVAYRYFATPRRKFIIIDTPGHLQYTRNMVTGASNADLALILIDARRGVLEQSRRHAFIASLLGIQHLVVCVNKMDLVGWSEERFDEVRAEFSEFAARLDTTDVSFIPISARDGDNVVERSPHMQWYQGATLLHLLEEVYVSADRNLIDVRFPVQYVIRDYSAGYRGYAGTVAGGVIRRGDEVVALPSGRGTRVASIERYGELVDEAFAPMAVTIRLEDELDISRGDMICRSNNRPSIVQRFEAMVCWMSDSRDLSQGDRLLLRQTTREVRATVDSLRYRIDVNTLHRKRGVDHLSLNDIGRVRFQSTAPVLFDEYRRNRKTGAFILLDEQTNDTVAAGMTVDVGV